MVATFNTAILYKPYDWQQGPKRQLRPYQSSFTKSSVKRHVSILKINTCVFAVLNDSLHLLINS